MRCWLSNTRNTSINSHKEIRYGSKFPCFRDTQSQANKDFLIRQCRDQCQTTFEKIKIKKKVREWTFSSYSASSLQADSTGISIIWGSCWGLQHTLSAKITCNVSNLALIVQQEYVIFYLPIISKINRQNQYLNSIQHKSPTPNFIWKKRTLA